VTSSRSARRARRNARRSGKARPPVFKGDFPDTGESVTEVLDRVRPPAYDGRTYRFTGASGPGLPDGGIYPAPAQTHQAAGRGWTMTVSTGGPGVPMDARLRAARQFLELEVADLAGQGMLYRIDDAEEARQRGEDPDERSVIAVTVAKAVRHLMGPREPWDPR
jgi:hypothetical protein